jgi:hypothetical protein
MRSVSGRHRPSSDHRDGFLRPPKALSRRPRTTGCGDLLATSPAATARTEADTTPPTAPGSLHAVSVTDVDVVLAWNASTDDSGSVNYAVFFDDNPTPFLTRAATHLDVHLNRRSG